MVELKKSGKHTLSYATFDDMRITCKCVLYFDEMNELLDLVKIIFDCIHFQQNQKHSDSIFYQPKEDNVKRLKDPERRKLIQSVIGNASFSRDFSPSGFFYESSWKEVNDDLIKEGFSVYNRVEKYYVYAFAIDFVRPQIFSKDCSVRFIDWLEEKQGRFIENAPDDYNENPVIKMVRNLNQ